MREWITGRNPIYEVLRSGRRHCFRLIVAQEVQERGRLVDILRWCEERKVPIERLPRQRLDQLGDMHQGVAMEVSGYPYCAMQDILELAQQKGEAPFLLILDTLQDPQNLGTLLRTAEIVGVHGALLPLRHTVTVTPAVVSASAGASEHLLIAQANLAQAIGTLKETGIWVVGLDGGAQAQPVNEARLDGPLAVVVGNEGQGMRPLVRGSCDALVRLPMRGRIASLNASVAGSVALYLVWQRRNYAGA